MVYRADPDDDRVQRLATAMADRYRIGPEIGAGGSATVYLADDLKHGRRVALKVLNLDLAGAVGAQRFLQEIHIAAALRHPNILPLHDSGELDELVYFVMPFLPDGSLRERLEREGPLPIAEATRIAREIAGGLEAAHRAGVTHRDIKPENILLDAGHAIIADFGIAAAQDALPGDRLTRPRVAVGTPLYMSPEQVAEDGEADARSDVYSLGCVIYEMLTGQPPHVGPSAKIVAARKIAQRAAPIRPTRPTVPGPLESVVLKALEIDPKNRYQSAGAFAHELATLESGRVPPTGRWSWIRTRTAAAVLGGVVLLSGVVLSWAVVQSRSDAPDPSRHAQVAVAEFENATGLADLDPLGRMALDWVTQGLQTAGVEGVAPPDLTLQVSRSRDDASGGAGAASLVERMAFETGARLVVHGSLFMEGANLGARAWITDASRGVLVASIPPARAPPERAVELLNPLRDRIVGYFALQRDSRIALPVELPSQPPTYRAYQLFDRGYDAYLAGRYSTASDLLEEAYREDNTFVVPLLFASIAQGNLRNHDVADSLLRIAEIRAGEQAPYYQGWMAYRRAFLEGDRPAALRAIRRVAEAAPGSKAVYNYAVEALENGVYAEALAALQSLDPERGPMRGWVGYPLTLGLLYHLLGLYQSEAQVGLLAAAESPREAFAIQARTRAFGAMGMRDSVQAVLSRALGRQPSERWLDLAWESGLELAAHGYPEDAQTVWRWALESDALPAPPERLDAEATARLLFSVGELERAAALLARPGADSSADLLGWVGALAALTNRRPDAEAVIARLDALHGPFQFGLVPLNQARIAAALGDTAGTIRYLGKAFAEGRDRGLWMHRDALLAGLFHRADVRASFIPSVASPVIEEDSS